MVTAKLASLLLLATLAFAQKPSSARSSAEPELPVIDSNACPFEGCTFGKWKVTKPTTVYSSWQKERAKIAELKPGDDVTSITGIHITTVPDRILVKQARPDLGLQPGDVVLRYMYVGEGAANVWFKGAWHKEFDCSFVTDKDGSGCGRDCSAVVTDSGEKSWWVQIKMSDGKLGWVLVDGNFDGMDSLG